MAKSTEKELSRKKRHYMENRESILEKKREYYQQKKFKEDG